jgi:hypothetical protein
MFDIALRDDSSSPLYVLARVSKHGTERVCISAPFLLTAVSMERGFSFDRSGQVKAIEFARASFNRSFSFTKSKAIQAATPRYQKAQLASAEAAASGLSNRQVIEELRARDSQLHKQYGSQRNPSQRIAYRDALACALLKRGLLVGMQDRTGRLFVH